MKIYFYFQFNAIKKFKIIILFSIHVIILFNKNLIEKLTRIRYFFRLLKAFYINILY